MEELGAAEVAAFVTHLTLERGLMNDCEAECAVRWTGCGGQSAARARPGYDGGSAHCEDTRP